MISKLGHNLLGGQSSYNLLGGQFGHNLLEVQSGHKKWQFPVTILSLVYLKELYAVINCLELNSLIVGL